MRIVGSAYLLVLLLSSNAGANSTPLGLTIVGPQVPVKSGAVIKVHLILTNTSPREITIADTSADCDYQVEVLGSNGKPARESEYGRGLNCEGPRASGRYILITLKPNQHREDDLTISDLYQMTNPGKYSVRVMRRLPKDIGEGSVSSNTIIITVTAH